jgi:hypothetical protein
MAVRAVARTMHAQIVHLLGGQQGAVDTRMARLSPASLAPRGPLGTARRGRRVRRRGPRRVAGVLAQARRQLLDLHDERSD